MNWNEQAERIMMERFGSGKDNIISLATVENGVPYVRYVNAYYEENSFYIITHALSNKMRHIQTSPTVAIQLRATGLPHMQKERAWAGLVMKGIVFLLKN